MDRGNCGSMPIPCMQDSEHQVASFVLGDIQKKVTVASTSESFSNRTDCDDRLSYSCFFGILVPLLMTTLIPRTKVLVMQHRFGNQLCKLLKLYEHCGIPTNTATQHTDGNRVITPATCSNGHAPPRRLQPYWRNCEWKPPYFSCYSVLWQHIKICRRLCQMS